ncbi:MAG: hypothetical protein U5L45_08955 [Saprospiraceae bacterium]|nr:hypothetical protein [Saprospiraceae bacterium]
MVRFSGFARKTNHIPLFSERSERERLCLNFMYSLSKWRILLKLFC